MANERIQPRIVMTPPAQPGASSHPRRPPAFRSVSLLHSPRKPAVSTKDQKSDSSSDSAAANRFKSSSGSPSSLLPLGRDSSGESSNAEKWFEKSNNEVRDNSASFVDNEPPFFMQNSSSSETPPDNQQRQLRQLLAGNDGSHSLPLRTGLLQLGTDGSSTEDFRSVIDDLTIENKRLKRRLKKYEKLHDSHLRDEKLFEVRIHGLAPEKKRELEETLRKFASSMQTGFPTNGYDGLLPVLNKQNTSSSQTSFHNADSAYASMSASGQGSSAPSGGGTRYKHLGRNTASRRQNMHTNIHTYLHHIPEGLLPHTNPANMTERAKKKLVVRRLEQIFAGKGAALSGHQHSLQQQDVSQMAARADRVASEAHGQRARQEGHREALIMRRGGKQDESNTSPLEQDESNKADATRQPEVASTTPAHCSNDQRPTRPLDLDPHRAQIPEDNVRYIRHLGFSPPDLESRAVQTDGHGWIYLNLLINMAQLHTINVTDNFVRKALTEYSSKFELSHDSRKVRWKGGKSVTRTSSSGGGSSRDTETNSPEHDSPRKRPKLSHRESGKTGVSGVQLGAVSGLRNQHENNKLVYTPLFFHKDSTDEGEESSEEEEDDSMSSPFPAPVAGESSGMTSSGMRTISTKKWKRRDDGPIIFYNNARFCTDLSGDRKANGNSNAPPYVKATDEPVGKPQSRVVEPLYEKRGPLAEAKELPEPMDLDDNPIPESMELSFPLRSPFGSDQKGDMKHIDLEVTGIGGVWPSDNFAIAVESRHARLDQDKASSVSHEVPSKRIPNRFASILPDSGRKTRAAVHKQIINTETKVLPPSHLPPALSFMPFGEDSLDDEDSDMDDEISVSPESPGALPPSAAPQPVQLHYTLSGEEDYDDDDDDDDDESDSSLDLLAAAREVDPEAVREQEREYDANMAERLAEEIPAGSSAATAGGGSGYASPEFGMNREEYKKALQKARARSKGLKTSATADSMKAQDPRTSSSEDEDGDHEMDDIES